jgi:hypothetical protein
LAIAVEIAKPGSDAGTPADAGKPAAGRVLAGMLSPG